ncbi:MAG: sulfate transporter CysZ [Pseudomonadota bacterium]
MSLLLGIECFSQGISRAQSKEVRPFILIPAAVSFVVIGSGMYFGLSYITQITEDLGTTLPEWLSFLEVIIAPILYVISILLGTWLFGFLATIIGSPFLGDLARAIENPSVINKQGFAGGIGNAIGRELRKLRYHLPRLLALLLLGFVPVVNAIAPFLWLLFGAWLMAVQFCDFSNENNQLAFEDTLEILRGHRIAALGFGACTTLALSIPLLNFVVGPVAAAGGTLLMIKLRNNKPVGTM